MIKTVIEDVVAESRDRDDKGKRPTPPLQIALREDAEQEELEQGKRKPIAPLRSTKPTEKQGRRGQQQQEDEGRHNLNHEFTLYRPSNVITIPLASHLLKQPSADKEETRQTEKKKHVVEAHSPIAQTIVTDM